MKDLKQMLARGEKIYGTMLRVVRNPAILDMARDAGFDFVMFDAEYPNYSIETFHDLCLYAHAVGIGCFVRVPRNGKDYVSRYLDCGALGVMVPMTETEKQARELVRWSKYPPLGERGFAAGGAPVRYQAGIGHARAMADGNDSVLSIAQIETRAAVENAQAIAATAGIDVLLIGPNDLSISMGVPGDTMHPSMLEAIEKVADACAANGKAFAIHAGPKMLERFSGRLDMLMMQNDIDILRSVLRSLSEKIRTF